MKSFEKENGVQIERVVDSLKTSSLKNEKTNVFEIGPNSVHTNPHEGSNSKSSKSSSSSSSSSSDSSIVNSPRQDTSKAWQELTTSSQEFSTLERPTSGRPTTARPSSARPTSARTGVKRLAHRISKENSSTYEIDRSFPIPSPNDQPMTESSFFSDDDKPFDELKPQFTMEIEDGIKYKLETHFHGDKKIKEIIQDDLEFESVYTRKLYGTQQVLDGRPQTYSEDELSLLKSTRNQNVESSPIQNSSKSIENKQIRKCKTKSRKRTRRYHDSRIDSADKAIIISLGRNGPPIKVHQSGVRAVYQPIKSRRGKKNKKYKVSNRPSSFLTLERLTDTNGEEITSNGDTTPTHVSYYSDSSDSSSPTSASSKASISDSLQSPSSVKSNQILEEAHSTRIEISQSKKANILKNLQIPTMIEKDEYLNKLEAQLEKLKSSLSLYNTESLSTSNENEISTSDLSGKVPTRSTYSPSAGSPLKQQRPKTASSVLDRKVHAFNNITQIQNPIDVLEQPVTPNTSIMKLIQESSTAISPGTSPRHNSFQNSSPSSKSSRKRPFSARDSVQNRNSTLVTEYSIDGSEYLVRQSEFLIHGIHRQHRIEKSSFSKAKHSQSIENAKLNFQKSVGTARHRKLLNQSKEQYKIQQNDQIMNRISLVDRSPSTAFIPSTAREFDPLHEKLNSSTIHDLKKRLAEVYEFPTRYEHSRMNDPGRANKSSVIANYIMNWVNFAPDPVVEVKQYTTREKNKTPTRRSLSETSLLSDVRKMNEMSPYHILQSGSPLTNSLKTHRPATARPISKMTQNPSPHSQRTKQRPKSSRVSNSPLSPRSPRFYSKHLQFNLSTPRKKIPSKSEATTSKSRPLSANVRYSSNPATHSEIPQGSYAIIHPGLDM